ncbi:ABC transporter permease subunit [Frigidibacter sp.]|uniref:ABC transporter permease subunit n=1 Tax=Frigidibacter sp. TaxID=2586418 RepID=UPI002733FE51|nr:ABC transporter permease subunit [Frigidibacter sp.]MDP3342166.1 ABC transporter permease subunit [Frigidibacter sp.]
MRNRKFRSATLQVLFVLAVMVILVSAVTTAQDTIATNGMRSGFGFLDRTTGVNIGFSVLQYDANSTYRQLILVGLVNTAILGILGIILAHIVGLVVAAMAISRNGSLNLVAQGYVELFRSIPLILQALFWYALVTHLPAPRNAHEPLPGLFLTGRGIFMPGLSVTGEAVALVLGCLLLGAIAFAWFMIDHRFRRISDSRRRTGRLVIIGLTLLACALALNAGRVPDMPLISVPELRGLNFRGGFALPPELTALAIAIAIYGGAYVSEILRAGFQAVPRGQLEAAAALGLRPLHVFTRVHLPMAFRAVLPTLTNQCVWMFKATTLGIAVGYSDLFYVISISITQSGQTLELIGILMLGFLVMNNMISFLLNRLNKAIALKGT